jgi:hypothetical protein
MKMKGKTCLLGWEIHAFDEKGKIYVKGRFVFATKYGILCDEIYTIVKRGECTVIYGKIEGETVALANVYLGKDESICLNTRSY